MIGRDLRRAGLTEAEVKNLYLDERVKRPSILIYTLPLPPPSLPSFYSLFSVKYTTVDNFCSKFLRVERTRDDRSVAFSTCKTIDYVTLDRCPTHSCKEGKTRAWLLARRKLFMHSL
ncbi:hypothetical protein K0M31_012408 [Melipona bicolor]|uniref:Uncharacterized protein n=1 Tax=Melipona bicolor TaxID=60889 RepID=A0AA40KHF7_9HYME|nr:hypothetical protein K0M31_012408 [Melipona bicolor]